MDFTKIRWAGIDCILITSGIYSDPQMPILILDEYDIHRLNEEWKVKTKNE